MELRPADWERLRELRADFLERGAAERAEPLPDYWRNARDLELYDATFAQRIAWRWAAVLAELAARGFPERPAVVLDWGCGTGAAARSWLERFGAQGLSDLHLVDRSQVAARFAAEQLRPLAGKARLHAEAPESCDLLLVSHVLDEAGDSGRAELAALCAKARSVVWLEPGTRSAARALVEQRELLRAEFELVAPCPHRGACGLAAAGREADWCHHFAKPPAFVFRDAFWNRAARELEIDLRALPYSFLALARAALAPPAPPEGLVRALGRPRFLRGRARLDLCSESGVTTRDFLERFGKERFKELGQSPERARLYRVGEADGRVSALEPWP
jgi:ribosomal protein RSM22 (predicted rRNA methylase)